ncbi:hypothetical protein BD626DRAFT_502823 [Schizophyllum amplum]|uniref:Probable RNA polymerase II nuclear localization protein SLC7A6OS n=1 Tax=Schizophyllum amplum TaxID=97359 RepID=A0A550C8J9_9AGAR|nr:hypothetical protein BD626DRAFT_502823 [Auriculariopsis ampla]
MSALSQLANTALAMDVDPPERQPYTLLRVKRKRNEEPLEGLVIESRARKKKSRGTVDLFSFAKTMEDSDWNADVHQTLRDEVNRLNREAKEKEAREKEAREKAAEADAAAIAAQPAVVSPPSPKVMRAQNQRYTVVPQEPEQPQTRAPMSPPKVWSSKELEQASLAPEVKMYDAVLDDGAGDKPASPMDAEIDKFIPMLDEYLKMNDIHTKDQAAAAAEDGANDYVWDVFYRRTANPDDIPTNWATVTGLPPSTQDYDSASDSEESDEADEDSNAEDWYANDYPEEDVTDEDDLSSDGFHEHSEHEDIVRGRGEFDSDDDPW